MIMTVNPGFGGQTLIPYTLDKVRELNKMVIRRGLKTDIEVDGGITPGKCGGSSGRRSQYHRCRERHLYQRCRGQCESVSGDDVRMWGAKPMCDVKKYEQIYNEIKKLQPEDTMQLVLEADTEEQREFYEMVGDYLLQKKTERVY